MQLKLAQIKKLLSTWHLYDKTCVYCTYELVQDLCQVSDRIVRTEFIGEK